MAEKQGEKGAEKEELYDDLLFPEDHQKAEEEEERSYVFETRLETANKRRLEGNAVLKDTKDIGAAIKLWKKALYHVDFDEMSYNYELMDKHRQMVDETRLPIYLNMAMALLTKGVHNDPVAACGYCSDALKISPDNTKALFRRGQAHLQRKNLTQAKEDLMKVAKLQPKDKAIRAELEKLRAQQQESKINEKQVWGGALLNNSSDEKKTHKSQSINDSGGTAAATDNDSRAPGKHTSRSMGSRAWTAFFSLPVAVAFIIVLVFYFLTRKVAISKHAEL